MRAALIAAAIILLAVGVSLAGYFVGDPDAAIPRAFALGFMTMLIVGGTTYLVIHFRSINQLDISSAELNEKEVLWAKTAQGMVYYKSGNALYFWSTVGGKLFLTNQFLEFRAGAGQPGAHRVKIPLREIRRAGPCKILGVIPGILRIERRDGRVEIFGFGAAFDVSREWADAIMEFRDDLEEVDNDNG